MGEVLEGENFAYNAPQFCNLSTANTEDDPRVEEYFNINHENVPQYEDISSDEETKQLYYTPLKLDPIAPQNPSILRKSMSMSNLLPTAKTIPIFRPLSKDRLNLLAQPKPRMTQACFESSAELITKFHQKTPKRFRTASAHIIVKPNQLQLRSNSVDINEEGKGPLGALIKGMGLTIPHSPLLATRSRSRPTMYIPHDVREEQELEELKKLQIKAKPVPKTNYGPAVPIKIDKKPSTVIQPFNLTRIAPKKPLALPEAAPIEFHAKPVPKSIFQKDNNETKSKPLKAIHTKPVPFSFQSRQEEVLKKREQLLTKVIEEEKKKREFHAQPIPKNVYKSPIKNCLRSANSKENIGPNNGSSAKSNNTNLANITLFKNTINSCDITFKAKPASVLKKEPFVPKLHLRPLTAISAFNLNTERRVTERETYEAKMRVKEEALAEIEYAKLQQDELKEKMEAALLRKQMEIKANPIRHFKPLLPVTPKGVTIPQTPKFVQKIYSATSSK